MRVPSLQALASLPMSSSAKRQLEKEFQNHQTRAARDAAGQRSRDCRPAGGARALQEQLWRLIHTDEELKCYHWKQDYVGAVPKRKYELDMCLPEFAIGCELDGWSFHGKRKEDFLRDRKKDYLLSLHGWQVYRLEAGLVYKDPSQALKNIREYLQVWLPRQKLLIEQKLVTPPLAGSDDPNNDAGPSE